MIFCSGWDHSSHCEAGDKHRVVTASAVRHMRIHIAETSYVFRFQALGYGASLGLQSANR